jgi:hypothetical protein
MAEATKQLQQAAKDLNIGMDKGGPETLARRYTSETNLPPNSPVSK